MTTGQRHQVAVVGGTGFYGQYLVNDLLRHAIAVGAHYVDIAEDR